MSGNKPSSERAAYVRYSDSVEVEQPNEAEDARESVAAFMRMCRFTFEKHRHGVRGAHAKSHGILKGELRVYDDLPEELRQGMFQTPRAYPFIVRYSTAPGDIAPDGIAAFRRQMQLLEKATRQPEELQRAVMNAEERVEPSDIGELPE